MKLQSGEALFGGSGLKNLRDSDAINKITFFPQLQLVGCQKSNTPLNLPGVDLLLLLGRGDVSRTRVFLSDRCRVLEDEDEKLSFSLDNKYKYA